MIKDTIAFVISGRIRGSQGFDFGNNVVSKQGSQGFPCLIFFRKVCNMEKNKMKTVYILTEEGREYTKAGCDYIADMVKNIVKDDSDLVFAMGAMYN